MKIKISFRAYADLESIYDYAHNRWGAKQAETYRRTIDDIFCLIAKQPKMGRVVSSDLKLRQFPMGKHIILYRVMSDAVFIVRIKSGSDLQSQS